MFSRLKTEIALVVAGIVLLGILMVMQHIALIVPGATNYSGLIGVPLDDVFIHCRFAQNLISGHISSFNPPEQVTADTSPLWVVLVACGGIFTKHLDSVAIVLSALSWLAIAPGVYRFSKHVFRLRQLPSVFAAVLFLVNGRALCLAASGMETSLAILLALVAMEVHIRSRDAKTPRLREAVILGLGVLTRPEMLLLVLLCMFDWCYLLWKKEVRFGKLLTYTSLLVGFVLAYVAIPLSIEGSLSYHSSIVQGFGFRFPPDLYYILKSYLILLEEYIYVLLFVLVWPLLRWDFNKLWREEHPQYLKRLGLPRFSMRTIIMSGYLIGLPILQGFFAPQYRHFGRYIFPLLPIVCLAVGVFADNILSVIQTTGSNTVSASLSPRATRALRMLQVAAVCVCLGIPTMRWMSNYANSVSNINDQHVAAAEWVRTNCTKYDVIAADDVGALGYIADRNIIDLTGLVSPDMYPLQHDQREVWKAARAKGADIFVIYTRLNPSFYAFAKDSLQLVKSFTVRPPLVSSADTTMSIFRLKGEVYAAR